MFTIDLITEAGRLVLSKNGSWVWRYMAINDQKWRVFAKRDAMEEIGKLKKQHPDWNLVLGVY